MAPQHATAPPVVTAHVWVPPAATFSSPATRTLEHRGGSEHSVPALPVQSTAMLMAYVHALGSDTVWFMRTTPSLEHEKRTVVERGVAPHASPPV
jgi:hypothetical protein